MNTREILGHLVGFDSTSRKSNLDLIRWIAKFLAQKGIDSRLVHDEIGTKANLWATIGPSATGGIILSGHTDVVPVDGQAWTSDPFALTEREGRLYGRGTSDMKGFVAVALSAIERFAAAPLARPIHLAFSYDEEVGCHGVRRLLATLDLKAFRPAACIVGEPTMMRLVTSQKGYLGGRCDIQGFECHSSMALEGVNAIQYAARIIEWLRQRMQQHNRIGPFDPRFTPPMTTIHVGTIRGGTATNIVPRDCGFDFEIRAVPSEDPCAIVEDMRRYCRETLEPEMRAINADCAIHTELLSRIPALEGDLLSNAVRLVRAVTGDNDCLAVAYGTEAGFFSEAGIPTVICGPGSIEQAHKPDEFIDIAQLSLGDQFMDRLAAQLCLPLVGSPREV